LLPFADVYADESSQQGHRYLVLGALIVERDQVATATEKIQHARSAHGLSQHEVKWGRVSNYHAEGYRAIVDAFFEMNADDVLDYHALAVDTSTFDHATHSGGDSEAGFNKLIFQLLLHRIGVRYGPLYRIEAYLDHRVTNQHPSKLREMLNAVLARDHELPNSPFRNVLFRRSHTSPLIQVCDILTGAIAYRKNGHHLRVGANAARCALAEYIMRQAVAAARPHRVLDRRAKRFSLWMFRYHDRR
jgi:hypothetical protein